MPICAVRPQLRHHLCEYNIRRGGFAGIIAGNNVFVTNYGTISGPEGIISLGAGSGAPNVGTAGHIGTNGTAIDFIGGASTTDTLNLLPGSRIIGEILLGTSDTVNIRTGRDIAWLLTFGCSCGASGITATGSTVAVTGGAPFAINGNQIATLDPTAFGLADRTLVDFTGNVSSLISSRFGEFASTGSSGTTGASAFAPTNSSVAGAANAAFDSIPAAANAYAQDISVPNATAVDKASGIAVRSSKLMAGDPVIKTRTALCWQQTPLPMAASSGWINR